MPNLQSALAKIVETRRRVPAERCALRVVTAEITDKLRKEGAWGADINVDGWLRLPHVRFSDTHPGRDSQPPQESLFSDYNTFAIVGSIKS